MSAAADLSTALEDFAAGRELDAGQAELLRRHVMGTAKRRSGLTSPEFDFSLIGGSTATLAEGRALASLADAAYVIAGGDRERGERLHAWMWPHIQTLVVAAKGKRYTGWSTASTGPVRYALFA